jgi:hypothetical protein
MQADYSGFTNAAAVAGNTFANLGQQIGETIKKRNENEKEIAGGIKMATAMKAAVPALGSMADEVIDNLSNANLSTNDKLLALAGVKEAMQMSLLGNQERRANAMLQLEAAKIQASMQPSNKVSKTTIGLGDGSEMDVLIDDFGNMTDVLGNPIGGQGTQGAAASVQAALPQGQGGMFPDNVASTGLPIGEAAEFTPGVSVDGSPNVLPPKQPVANQPRYGVRSPKPTAKFRSATKEELAQNNATAGQVDEVSGRFYRQDPPSGMEIKSDGEGGFTLIQGSGAGQKAQGAMDARKKIGEQGLGVVLENLGAVYDQINKVSDSVIGAAAQSQIAKLLPATEIGAIKDQIETVNNNISFDTVNQLRASSATGSAGGNITEKEWPRFEGRLGKMYVGQNKDLFIKNVKSIAYTMYDAVNGTPEEVDKLLDENKITQQDYNNYLSERSSLKMKFGSVNSTNPIEEAKSQKATDNPFTLDQTLDKDIDNFLNQ